LLGNLAAGKQKRRVVQMAVWFVSVFLGVLFTDSSHLFLAGSLLGVLCAWPLSGMRIFGGEIAAQTENTRQHLLAELLQQMSQCLMQPCRSRPEPETAAVFDRAAERVCRLCARREDCWDTRGQETYLALEQAAVPMMTRGKALREDFPMAFSAQCRHMEGLLQAMNREMDDLSCRRQYRSRLRESRTVLAQQYAALSHALVQELREDAPCRYAPEIGFRSLGRRDSTVSGDRGAGFRRGKWYFVLLCDGMGTGQWAKAEAETAIEILRSLLQAGTSAEEALQVLNGIYILRDDGGFATVDLLQADLQTGAAVLYKWGAAPSYYKQKDTVKQLRSSQLPPGVEAAPMSGGRGIPLDLGQGEVLLLVSDGVDADAAERYIRQHSGRSVKELASGVIAAGGAENRDDTTAVAVCLHRE